jgi:asparagine synthase (glutamine-hydrolysing)
VLTRATKASFDAVFWHRHTQEFVRSFDGTGVDHDLVDVAALRRCWAADSSARVREMVPLQAAWLAADSARAEPLEEHGAGLRD